MVATPVAEILFGLPCGQCFRWLFGVIYALELIAICRKKSDLTSSSTLS